MQLVHSNNGSNWGYTQITIVAAALFGQALIGNRLLDFIPHVC